MTLEDVGAILLTIICGVIVTEIVLQERRMRRLDRRLNRRLNDFQHLNHVYKAELEQWRLERRGD